MTRTLTAPNEGLKERTVGTDDLRQDLQAVLGQLFELHVQSVEAHAHFIGTRFTGFQRQLEAIVDAAREASRAVAEVLHGLDGGNTRGLIMTEVPPLTPGLR